MLNTLPAPTYPLDDTSASNRIQARLKNARQTFRANDNIAAFIEDGELDEVFAGRCRAAPQIASFPNVSRLNELMIVGPITVRSACSHHLCPIIGRIWVGVLPNTDAELIGLSKFARLCDWIMSRSQIQEKAVIMLADELESRIRPDGLAVVMEADHFCMHWRGVKDGQPVMTSSIMRCAFLENEALRREFLELRNRGHQ